jgi:hypothetical protein
MYQYVNSSRYVRDRKDSESQETAVTNEFGRQTLASKGREAVSGVASLF